MTGIELIAQERKEQIEKHKRTIEADVMYNAKGQLIYGAVSIINVNNLGYGHAPEGWNTEIWKKMIGKLHKERLIIAGALIAAEIDRLNYKGE